MKPYYETINGDFTFQICHRLVFPLHFHTQVELIYIVKGSLVVSIGQNTYHMDEGDFGIIFPGQPHEYQEHSDGGVAFLAIFQPELTPKFLHTLTKYSSRNSIIKKEDCHPDIAYAMNALYSETQLSAPNNDIYPIFLQLLVSRVLSILPVQRSKTSIRNTVVYRVTEYLAQHYLEPITLSDVAESCDISKNYLSRVFAQQIGTTFPNYLNNLRINEAQTKLCSTSLSVTDIAYACGFDNPRSFNRNFIKITGMTPSEYRSLYYTNYVEPYAVKKD